MRRPSARARTSTGPIWRGLGAGLFAGAIGVGLLGACAAAPPSVVAATPVDEAKTAGDGGALDARVIPTTQAVADAGAAPEDAAVTFGVADAAASPTVLARRAPDEKEVVCKEGERRTLSFSHSPVYTDRVELDGTFRSRFYVGNSANCPRQVSLPLSFTPPRTTATRTLDFVAYVPGGGAFVEVRLSARELEAANVVPGRYAITFAVLDEKAKGVGRALSGNPLRFGRDEIVVESSPKLPQKIAVRETLVVPFVLTNRGDTANRVTPLVVFTRPGTTAGIEYYGDPFLVVPGTATYLVRLDAALREEKGIKPGSWLVTLTSFDAAGDRMNSVAGLPLSIGVVDLRVKRPELPTKLAVTSALRVVFDIENKGDAADVARAVVAFTKPGTAASHEFVFKKELGPGRAAVECVVEATARRERGVGKGAWLMTTALYSSSGERVRSFTGHYLEIED